MPTLKLKRKYLSPVIVWGLMAAIVDVYGMSGTNALLRLAINDYLPAGKDGKPDEQFISTYLPFWSYLYPSDSPLQAVDWAYFPLLQPGLAQMYGEPAAKGLALKFGQAWWHGTGNNWDIQNLCRLENMIGADILGVFSEDVLNQIGVDSTGTTLRPNHIYNQIFENGFPAFGQAFTDKIGIPTRVQVEPDHFLIQFTDCPFCANQRKECTFLYGLVKGIVHWLTTADHFSKSKLAISMTPPLDVGRDVSFETVEKDAHKIRIPFLK